LTQLYKYSFAYVHGHEFGGTNPTMINALYFNCQIIALNTVFNKEMTKNKKVIFFDKNVQEIKEKFNEIEVVFEKIKTANNNYEILNIYNCDNITCSYLNEFLKLIKTT
jgi:hypothetical protein